MDFARTLTIIAVAWLALGADWTLAQGTPRADVDVDPPGANVEISTPGAELEITMMLMPQDGELPVAVTRELTLPNFPPPPEAAGDGAENGADGLAIADQAREDGRAVGREAAAAAQDNREDLGRGVLPEDLPLGPPEGVPSPPDGVPGPPDGVPGPPDGVPSPP